MSENDKAGLGELMGAVVRIADSFDRLVTLLEEIANAVELPTLPVEEAKTKGG